MNFEKIEIYGFKSFADKAEIKFGNGITGIVGPNGCGKSNVADAIRWVLGEQSAKSLRGSSMQDVIFAGTQGRKSLSYCEVSLYFDNSNRMFSLDYNEVIITRKLFRSGESEYYINKQQSRLRDIIDLLRECGIGKEGYTIIGQGKVEEIMSAKPEDRRVIFEEATGISKFKSRKNESERKLERTHENIIRYTDILSEIESNLGPLENQAKKAKEFNELSEQLKFHELNTYMAKVEGVESSKNKIYQKMKGIEEETALRQKELEDNKKDHDNVLFEISNADNSLRALNEELLEKRVSMEKSSGAKQLYEQRITHLLGQVERANKEIESNETLIKDSKTNFSKNLSTLEEIKEQIKTKTAENSTVNHKLTYINEKIALNEELAEAHQKKVIESIESLTDIKVNKGTMSIEKSNLLEKKNELTEKLDGLCVKRDNKFNEKEALDNSIAGLDRSVFDLKNEIDKTENRVREGNERVAKIDNEIYSLGSVITSLVTKDNFYKGLKENYEGYIPSVKLLLNKAKENPALKSKIKGVVAELIKSDRKYDIALETALASSAQNVVTATPDDAKYLIEYLKVNKFGRVTFLPITSVKPREQSVQVTNALAETGALGVANKLVTYTSEYENVISNLLGNTLIVDNIENATRIAQKYRFAFKIVTLDGDVFSTQGAMTGGSRRQESVGILSGDRKIEENANLLKAKREEMEKAQKEKGEIEVDRDKALDELSVLNEMITAKRQQVVVEREKSSLVETALIELGKDIEAVNDLIEEIDKRISEVDAKYQAVLSGGDKLERERINAKDRAGQQQLEFDGLKKERDALLEKSTLLQVELTELNARITALDNENSRLKTVIKESEEIILTLKNNVQGAEKLIEGLRIDQEKVALTKEEQDYVNGIRKKIEEIDNSKVQLNNRFSAIETERQRLNEAIGLLTEKKHAEEIALAKIDSDLEYLQQSIWEDYQETYETAQKVKEPGYDGNAGEQEINRLRRKRSSLGAINATAIEDFKLLKERYEEMNAQKEDLEKAEADIQQAIDKIKEEMLTQFDEGFNKINENFKRIFKELFGGGRAMLELDYTNATDKLEAGVEIIAEPPGKKLQKLSLLSGGEKALTAIAILFSILRLRPMPFCVLDEIEAALDEANVDRFARYLKKFSEETQFIVITHRKPTMELADALFGVTMQEKGVSKTVSVKLSDVAVDQLG